MAFNVASVDSTGQAGSLWCVFRQAAAGSFSDRLAACGTCLVASLVAVLFSVSAGCSPAWRAYQC